MCDTTRQNGGSGETDAQVKILIYHLLMALRGIYKKTGIVDNPVPNRDHIQACVADTEQSEYKQQRGCKNPRTVSSPSVMGRTIQLLWPN